ncbi:siderophore ABC transporter substrate-binding protein [Actinotalea sp. BY-33]|uniref:Siderophore ABC transporter substrate-binding protein n=1 Tax=Actinotalea soli TaxID=2819234 RepID=A0A939LPG3_9CELL|nr:siderophore ABC transporter substrate-binding protein [Actinotalea soli]MBO1751484.1 siderophore ABC transporter substrate-binding protein [Actinotalea soli]
MTTTRTRSTSTTGLLRPVALAAAAALALAGCAGDAEETTTEAAAAETDVEPAEVTVTHAQGETTVPVDPETVLVFDFATIDTLAAIGVEVDGLPKSNLPGDLAAYDTEDYLDIGTLFEPDYEAVNAAEPDLIIVAGRSSEALPELSAIAPTIDLSNDWEDFRGSIEENARTLGQIFAAEAEIEELITALDADIETTREAAADAGEGLIVLTSGGEVTAYGPGSRFGFVHDELGVTPAVEDVEEATHGEAISFEFIAEADPDWLFVVDRDSATGDAGAAAAEVLDNELVAETTAWREDNVLYVDSVDWYIVNGGLGTLQRITDEVASALAG